MGCNPEDDTIENRLVNGPDSFCKSPWHVLLWSSLFYLNNKLDILGRLHLFGYNPVHVEQSYVTSGCEVPRVWVI